MPTAVFLPIGNDSSAWRHTAFPYAYEGSSVFRSAFVKTCA